ncbi:MAG: hypothetical protein Q7K43_00190 [Candidatus Woesearchaeota archaeon]|nr:hypothetical protein [Candidatus Woesearchaeota archaeon]
MSIFEQAELQVFGVGRTYAQLEHIVPTIRLACRLYLAEFDSIIHLPDFGVVLSEFAFNGEKSGQALESVIARASEGDGSRIDQVESLRVRAVLEALRIYQNMLPETVFDEKLRRANEQEL